MFFFPEMCSVQSGSVCGSLDPNYSLSNLTDVYLNTVVFFFFPFSLLPFLEAVGSSSQLYIPPA